MLAFTVFTPVYNRAHTLPRVFNSLHAQTFKDFEWLIVDDGSTDDVQQLVALWSAELNIRYFRQAHSGKHIAHNLAVREARGKLFVPLDSDDELVEDALERMMHWWQMEIANRVMQKDYNLLCELASC